MSTADPWGPRSAAPSKPDDSLDLYMRDVSRHPLMTAHEERERAEQIVALRIAYWRQIMNYYPLVERIAGLVRTELTDPGAVALARSRALAASARDRESAQAHVEREARALDALRAACDRARDAAVAVRGRDRKGHRIALAAAVRDLADAVADRDQECALADRIVADLERLSLGSRGTVLLAHPPRQGSRPFAEYLAAVRRGGAALRAARNRFVRANLRLVVRMANRLRSSGVPLPDLVQEGNIGLLKAIARFEPERGLRFSTYASWWVRHTMRRAVVNRGRVIRLPQHLHTLHHKAASVRRMMLLELGREPAPEELSDALGVTVATVLGLDELTRPLLSLDAEAGPDHTDSLGDRVVADEPDPDDLLDAGALDDKVRAALDGLDERGRTILLHRFGLDGRQRLTLAEVGKLFDLSRERIRQLEALALEHMRSLVGVS